MNSAPPRRIDWPAIWHAERDRIDLAAVATDMLGPAPGRRGEHGRHLWWPCPFHRDVNPSLAVEPGKSSWRCFGCGDHGDAVSLVMRLERMTFPDAVAKLTGRGPAPSGTPRPRPDPPARPAPDRPPPRPSGLPVAEALALVAESEDRLWSPGGSSALDDLREGRGLADATIRAARLGWTPGVRLKTQDGRDWTARGVVIPWFDGDRLALVKVRQPDGARPKYAEAYRDRPGLYPGGGTIRPGRPLIVVEGEFDALLLGQELADLASVVTLGSASARPGTDILVPMLAAAPWYIATDRDEAGEKSAEAWPSSSRRVRPPGSFKDWCEASAGGVDLARWWREVLAGVERPELFTWDELSRWRWGPAVGDAEPGITIRGRREVIEGPEAGRG